MKKYLFTLPSFLVVLAVIVVSILIFKAGTPIKKLDVVPSDTTQTQTAPVDVQPVEPVLPATSQTNTPPVSPVQNTSTTQTPQSPDQNTDQTPAPVTVVSVTMGNSFQEVNQDNSGTYSQYCELTYSDNSTNEQEIKGSLPELSNVCDQFIGQVKN